ncbi:protein LOW PSII ACCUMULATION 3, chloroplastic isoform X1 [Setaria italica]|uniref:uncharacterized protein n=1 Tax=Setaria viridis TaxID=4556 RepID=UPI000648719F|nr:protein LOW PSII ACCUMULATION 3, chloroplastic isoform X1 [Setaria italica]XP_034574902.1 protein LOW PSII ACCUMULATION 3, chloroplastic-like isoform X1 [Setaria viridis]
MAAPAPTALCARHFRLPRVPFSFPSPPRLPATSSRLRPRRLAVSPRAEAGTGTGMGDVEALRAGVSVYKPRSYDVLVSDAARSLACAIDDGKTRLEIEFPARRSSFCCVAVPVPALSSHHRSFPCWFTPCSWVALLLNFDDVKASAKQHLFLQDEFIDANIQLAPVVARKLKELKRTRSCIVSSSFIRHH